MNTLKKCSCGYYNPVNADKCMFCGKLFSDKRRKRVLIIFEDEREGFQLIRRIKKYDIDLKVFKPSTIFVGKLEYVDFIFFMMDIRKVRNKDLLERLKNKFESAKIIAVESNSENFKVWNSFGVNYVLENISSIDDILSVSDRESLPIYSISDAEKILHSFSETIKLLLYSFKDFYGYAIENNAKVLEDIYKSLKRSDIFLLVSNLGFLIVPFDQNDIKGIEALKKKLDLFIGERTIHKRFISSIVCNFSVNSKLLDFVNVGNEAKNRVKPDIVVPSNSDEQYLDVHDPYVLKIAVDEIGEDAAFLFFDDNYRKKIDPFLTLKVAKKIVDIKKYGYTKSDISRVKDKFLSALKDISEKFSLSKEKAFLSTLSSDTQLLSLPEIQTNIIMLINEDASFRRIINEIQKDPAITSKILRFANSAFFGLKGEIKSINRAAIVLGTEEILGITLSISYLGLFNSKFTKDLYKYSIATLAISKHIEDKANVNASITLGSIIHVIGNMFYAQYKEKDYKNLVDYLNENKVKYEKAEGKFFPARSSELGYKLSVLWSFPKRVGQVIKNWFFPAYVSKFDTSLHLVHASAMMARALGYFYEGYSLEDMSYHTYNLFYRKFGINLLSMFKKDVDEIKNKIEEMMYILS